MYYGVVRVDGERAILRMRRYTLADGTRVYRDVTLPGTYGELEARALAYGLERLAFAEGEDVLGKLPMPPPD